MQTYIFSVDNNSVCIKNVLSVFMIKYLTQGVLSIGKLPDQELYKTINDIVMKPSKITIKKFYDDISKLYKRDARNYVMKEFGVMIGETYKKDKSAFNEYYFKKCICAAIIYRKTDFYLEKNKWDSDFWYKPGGYKGNIVPYTISRIIDLIPPGYTLDWNYIWNNQDISEAFFNEIKRLTFLTNNYFCGLTGVLVSEHCKKETTWEDYKANVPYELSTDFKSELITCEEDKRNASQSRSEQKDVNELQLISNIIAKGAIYWKELLTKGKAKNLLIPSEISRLNDIITFVNRGNIPMGRNGKVPSKIMALINDVITIEGKLNDEGLIDFGETFEADDDVVVLNIDNYKIHK